MVTELGADDLREIGGNPLVNGGQACKTIKTIIQILVMLFSAHLQLMSLATTSCKPISLRYALLSRV